MSVQTNDKKLYTLIILYYAMYLKQVSVYTKHGRYMYNCYLLVCTRSGAGDIHCSVEWLTKDDNCKLRHLLADGDKILGPVYVQLVQAMNTYAQEVHEGG